MSFFKHIFTVDVDADEVLSEDLSSKNGQKDITSSFVAPVAQEIGTVDTDVVSQGEEEAHSSSEIEADVPLLKDVGQGVVSPVCVISKKQISTDIPAVLQPEEVRISNEVETAVAKVRVSEDVRRDAVSPVSPFIEESTAIFAPVEVHDIRETDAPFSLPEIETPSDAQTHEEEVETTVTPPRTHDGIAGVMRTMTHRSVVPEKVSVVTEVTPRLPVVHSTVDAPGMHGIARGAAPKLDFRSERDVQIASTRVVVPARGAKKGTGTNQDAHALVLKKINADLI